MMMMMMMMMALLLLLLIIIIIIIMIIILIMVMIMIMMMMMMIIIIIIIIIIIVNAYKGAIRDCNGLLTALRTVYNSYGQVARAQSCANHVQHIERLSRATSRVPYLGTAQLLGFTGFKSHLFEPLSYWLNH